MEHVESLLTEYPRRRTLGKVLIGNLRRYIISALYRGSSEMHMKHCRGEFEMRTYPTKHL